MRRIFWMAVGAGAGVWAVNKANEAARRLTPTSLAGTATRGALDIGDAVRQFADEVRVGMAERERQLRGDLGLDGGRTGGPSAARGRVGHRTVAYRAIAPAPGSPEAGQVRRIASRRPHKALGTSPDQHDAGPGPHDAGQDGTHNRKDH